MITWNPGGGELNLDQTVMCHRRLKFITLFWSGKTQKGYPALELPLFFNLLYCIVLYCIRDEDHVYALLIQSDESTIPL